MKNSRTDIRTLTIFALAVLLFAGFGCKGTSQEVTKRIQPITLEYWRVFDGEDTFGEIVAAYQVLHPNITIRYTKMRYEEYEKKLLDALAEDKGPDIFSLHNTWMRAWQPRLLPMPASLSIPYREVKGSIKKEVVITIRQQPGMTIRQMANDYIDAVQSDMILPTEQADPRAPAVPQVYGLPLSVDTMALYYNRDTLNNAGIASPATDWKSFQDQVKKITLLDETGAILRSGAALGTASNVERSSEILALLMMQNGANMTSDDGHATFDKFPAEAAGRPLPPGAEALVFYTDFANPEKEVYTWNDKMPDSLTAFVNGQTAFFFGYAYHLPQIRQLSRQVNPKLNFGIAPMPQIAGNQPVNFANYWAEVVSKKTAHPDEAWDFLMFATKAENAQKYLQATGKPTAHRSLVSSQLENLDLSVFASQLPSSRTWYRGTGAKATEDAMDELMRQTLAGEADPRKLLELAAIKVNQTVR